MNNIRKQVHLWLKEHNIEILSYVHPSAVIAQNAVLGEGNIIMEHVTVQPFTKLGDCNILWNGVNISHYDNIGNYNYLAPGVTMAGYVNVGNCCFLGTNCIVKNKAVITDEILVGAGAYVYKNLNDKQVFVPQRGIVLDKTSDEIKI